MIQSIIVGVIFVAALFFIGRFIFRQINAGKEESAHCDKCIPKQTSGKLKIKG